MHLYDAPYLNLLHQRFAAVKRRSHELLHAGPGQTVVDVGCGLGHDAAVLATTGATVIGLDPNEALLNEAWYLHGQQVEFRNGTAQAMGLADTSVDALRYERVLQHLTDHDAVLAEAHRVLHPGGRLQVVDTDWLSMTVFLPDAALERKLIDSIATRYCCCSALLRLLPSALLHHGFKPSAMELCNVLTEIFAAIDSVVHQFVAAEIATGHFTNAEQASWQQANKYCFIHNFLLIQAVKP